MRLGDQQLRLLVLLGSPGTMLVVGDKVSDSLVRRGLLREDKPQRGIVIAPNGLRALADAMQAGRVKDILQKMKAETAKRARDAKRRQKARST